MAALDLLLGSRRAVFVLAGLLAAGVFGARLAVDDPHEPIMFLLVIPVGLAAAEAGLAGGLAAATIASALVVTWDLTADADLTPYGYVARWAIFYLSAATVGTMSSARKQLEKELREVAHTDSLTGLPNRRYFEQEATRQLDFIRRYGRRGAMVVFDIDGFKTINDTLGHRAGDEALVHVARAVRDRLRKTDLVARIGGDEFALLLPETDRNEAQFVAMGLQDVIGREPVARSNRRITSSMGIRVFTASDDVDLRHLLDAADQAMYEAKRAGGGRFAFAEAAADDRVAGAER